MALDLVKPEPTWECILLTSCAGCVSAGQEDRTSGGEKHTMASGTWPFYLGKLSYEQFFFPPKVGQPLPSRITSTVRVGGLVRTITMTEALGEEGAGVVQCKDV